MVLAAAALLALAGSAAPVAALDARWMVPLETAPSAAAGFDDSTAYVPVRGGQLIAVDLDRGIVRWHIDLVTSLTPATGEGLVFAATADEIAAYDAQSGAVRWRHALPGGVAAPLYWDTGWLVASTPAGDLLALRASDGFVVWRQALGAPVAVAPAPALDQLFVALTDGQVMSLALSTGESIWSRSIAGHVSGLLALDDQLVFGTTQNEVQSVTLTNGHERWRWRVGGDVVGAPFADARHIYFAARDNVLRAVDRKSGNLRWTAALPSRPSGGPFVAAEAVMVPFVSSDIVGFDPVSGKNAITVKAAGEIGAQPYLRLAARATAARLITVSRDGRLQGFGLRFEPPSLPLATLPGAKALP